MFECTMVDGNFATWGRCMQDSMFLGDPIIFSLGIMFIFALIVFFARLPVGLALPGGAVLFLALMLMFGAPLAAVGVTILILLLLFFGIIIISFMLFPRR